MAASATQELLGQLTAEVNDSAVRDAGGLTKSETAAQLRGVRVAILKERQKVASSLIRIETQAHKRWGTIGLLLGVLALATVTFLVIGLLNKHDLSTIIPAALGLFEGGIAAFLGRQRSAAKRNLNDAIAAQKKLSDEVTKATK